MTRCWTIFMTGIGLITILACGGGTTPTPKSEEAQPAGEQTEGQKALATCSPGEPEVKYDGQTFTATFCAADFLKAGGECRAQRGLNDTGYVGDNNCFAGATLRRAEDAFHYDLPVVEVSESDLAAPIRLSAKVGPGFVEYIVGVWTDKEPCSTGRHGCEAYGYLVFENRWSFPYAYAGESTHPFAKISPTRVKLLDAGGGAALVKQTKGVLEGYTFVDGGKANNTRHEIQVMYRAKWDRFKAWDLANTLEEAGAGYHWSVMHWAEAPEDFVIAVGG